MYFQDFQHPESSEYFSPTALDGQRELKLVLEVADIIDELKMIRHLVDTQREVLRNLIFALRKFNPSCDAPVMPANSTVISNVTTRSGGTTVFNIQYQDQTANLVETTKLLAQAIAVPARDSIMYTEEVLVSLLTEISTITSDADYTHKMARYVFRNTYTVGNMPMANMQSLIASHSARPQAENCKSSGSSSNNQAGSSSHALYDHHNCLCTPATQPLNILHNRTDMVFPKLPLSFFTSYFGQNVSEITGSEENPTTWELWRVGSTFRAILICVSAVHWC
jgi:hypothetical protein